MMTQWDWIVPFKGRNHSGATVQNFLCRSGNIYVMDNHRAALWCWLQQLDLSKSHSLIHIDRHTDTLQSQMDQWLENLPDWTAGIDEHLGKKYDCGGFMCPVIRWDNYLSVYLHEFGPNLKTLRFLTHDDGDPPNYNGTMFSPMWDLPENMSYWLSGNEAPWVVNVDLDYFFCDADDGSVLMISDEYLETTFGGLRDALDRGVVGVLTLCLAPDSFTPGWEATEQLAARILAILGMEFRLPSV
jgi:hypothetical protein